MPGSRVRVSRLSPAAPAGQDADAGSESEWSWCQREIRCRKAARAAPVSSPRQASRSWAGAKSTTGTIRTPTVAHVEAWLCATSAQPTPWVTRENTSSGAVASAATVAGGPDRSALANQKSRSGLTIPATR